LSKYEKNPKSNRTNQNKEAKNEGNDDAPLEDLLDLIQQENEDEPEKTQEDDAEGNNSLEDLLNLMESDNENNEESKKPHGAKTPKNPANLERKKITIKRDKPIAENLRQSENSNKNALPPKNTQISSITITKVPQEEKIYVEKNTGIRVTKSGYKSEIEMNALLACNYGKFYKLTELSRRAEELKSQNSDFFSVFILGSKTESKCSAKGNSYVIWTIHDLGNLERQQEISLFLFGGAYKSHWKSTEFSCFAIVKPEFLNNNNNNNR
jgi:hypothetical protein